MSISRTVKWKGQTLTKGDLLELLGDLRSAPDDLIISVDKSAYEDRPGGGGGLITLTAELPREQVIQKD